MLLLILLTVLSILVYFHIIKPLKYWEERGIPYLKPIPILGNMAPNVFQRCSMSHLVENFYKAFPGRRYGGVFQFLQPTLLIRDLELFKKITVKEFDSFPDHRPFAPPSDPLWSRNLVALPSKNGWEDMRATLSPSFTSSKMKSMFGLMQQCAVQFTDYFQKQNGMVEVEFKDAFTRYTNDVIGTTAFGVTCDSLKDRDNEFYVMGKDACNFTGLRGLKFFGCAVSPQLMNILKVSLFSKEVNIFFRRLIKETLKVREEKQVVRPDMIHLLMEARKGRLKHDDEDSTVDSGFAVARDSKSKNAQRRQKQQISDEDITAQALIFFLGGFDSSSTLMGYLAYELAINPDIQNRLRGEIGAALEICNHQITYEALLGMKYLDCVVSETLRKWPIQPFLDRYCRKPFTIEPELPDEKPVHLQVGDVCLIPVYPVHRDPQYYPDPEKFEPERFNDENKHKIKPFSYMPFGSGPRNCIGSRFALLETKLIIVELMRKFELVPTKKTQIPMIISKKDFSPLPSNGFWLGLKPRTDITNVF